VLCKLGTYKALEGDSMCINCPAHTYSTTVIATTSDVCESCPEFSLSSAGSDELEDCVCQGGYYEEEPE